MWSLWDHKILIGKAEQEGITAFFQMAVTRGATKLLIDCALNQPF